MQNRTHLNSAICVVILLAGGCATTSETPVETNDEVLQRNLAAMMAQPGIADIDWRQPKEIIRGQPADRFTLTPEHFPAPAALIAALDDSRQLSGRGLMVWYDGQLVASDFTDGLDSTTPTATYSMHKSVLAIAILQAIESGILAGLDAPVGNYLTDWRRDPRGKITLRQLLTHTSGLEHHPINGQSTKSRDLVMSAKIRETALTFEQTEPAGTKFNYNNVNTQIAGLALEDALQKKGLRYSEFLSEKLWQPLGNHDAALWMEKPDGTARYYSGLEAGLEDWLALGVMLIDRGRYGGRQVLQGASVSSLLAASTANPAYGLSVWRGELWEALRSYGPSTPFKVSHSEPYFAEDVYFFDGFGGQRVYIVPSQRLVVARTGEVDFAYDDAAIVNRLLRGLQSFRQKTAQAEYRSENVTVLYQQRFERLMREAGRGGGLAGYDPLTPLVGSESYEPIPVAPAAGSWLDADTRETLKEYLAPRNTQAFYVWHQGALLMAEYFGDNDADSMVISRSLSKPLSVIAVGRALQLGYLKTLDQPASDYFHEWRGTDREAITIRQILQMRSGLEAQRPSRDPNDIMNLAYLHPYHTEVIINQYPLVSEPGTRYDYSNANGELVAPLLERATGQRYEDWLSRTVLKPIGAAGGSIWLNRPGGTAHSGCCALLPAETFLRLSMLLINDGHWGDSQLLPDGYVTMMSTPTPQNPHTAMGLYVAGDYVENRGAANPDVPFGKNFHSEPYLDKDLYLFDGNGHQVSFHVPRHDLIVMRVGTAPPDEFPWDNAYLPNTVLKALSANTGAELAVQPRP